MKSFLLFAACLFATTTCIGQSVNAAQHVTVAGLRAGAGHGSFPASVFAPDGSLLLLYDQRDGVRVLKLNAAATQVPAEAHLGATGDVPVAMSLDPNGNIYVTGTTANSALIGSSGTAFPARADASTNSFLAKFSATLDLQWLTFLGSGRTSAAAIPATADAVFVAGLTFSSSFPVTSAGIQQAPAQGASQNGFVERFSPAGQLVYATYLTGAQGNTAPTVIAADAQDNAYVAGYTSSPGYPTFQAIVPEALDEDSGFLTVLTPQGDGFVYSTYLPGSGVTGMALDSNAGQLVLTGAFSLGGLPFTATLAPLTSAASYQALLRIPLDGQSIASSTVLAPGGTSSIALAPDGSTWVTGSLSSGAAAPAFPGLTQPLAMMGDSFALHLLRDGTLDQTLRFGALRVGPLTSASVTSALAAPAVSTNGTVVAFPGTLTFNLTAAQRFDLPTVQTPSAALPTTVRDVASACASGTCFLNAGYLTLAQNTAAPSLALSYDDAPNLTLRNLGTATADALTLVASGSTITSNCGQTLLASNACSIALSMSGSGTVTASAAATATETVPVPAGAVAPRALAVSPAEIDFGVQTAASEPATRTFSVTNLSASPQTFSSAQDTSARSLPYALKQVATDCPPSGAGTYTLASNTSCHITLALTVMADAVLRTAWKAGPLDVTVTGIAQVAALSVSTNHVQFGTQIAGGPVLARTLFLSNLSSTAVAHAAVTLPEGSPFRISDECPSMLLPKSVCRLSLRYEPTNTPSADSVTLTLDQGLVVTVTGNSLPAAAASGASVNPAVAVSPSALTFTTPVVVTGVSSERQTVTVRNMSAVAQPIAVNSKREFPIINGCGATLAGNGVCTVQVAFTPAQPGVRQGLLSISSGANFSPAYVALSGAATALLPSNNGTLALGQILTGEPLVAWFKVQQSLSALTVATNSPDFSVALVEDTGNGHGTLPPAAFNQSVTASCSNCWLGVEFLSQNAGSEAATLTISTVTGGNPYSLTLTATALPVSGLVLTPVSQDFGPIAVHSQSAAQVFSLTNLTIPASPVSAISTSATGDFTVVASPNSGPPCTGTLAPGSTCFVGVTFAPSAAGQRNGTLTFTTSTGSATAALSGFGAPDPGLSLDPAALNFRNVPGTTATQQTITVTNPSSMTLNLSALTASDPAFVPSTNCSALDPAASCSITVAFHPGAAQSNATLTFVATALVNGQSISTPYTVALAGLYTQEDTGLAFYPEVVNFGTLATGAVSRARTLTLANLSGKTVSVALEMPREFALTAPAPCPTLAPGGSCQIDVLYLPADGGPATGTVFAHATPTDGSAALQSLAYLQAFGTASGSLLVSGSRLIPHAPINFGAPLSGQTTQQKLNLTNNGATPVSVRRVLSEPPFFAATDCGATLAPNASCGITITYAPVYVAAGFAVPRNDAGTLIVLSDAADSPITYLLSGTVQAASGSSSSNGAVLATYDLSQGSLTFANTQPGNASTAQTLTLTNTGSITLHVLRTVVPSDFTATTDCDTLLPGASCTYNVRFRPDPASSTTARSGTLEIQTDSSVALEFVTLFGTASAPQITLSATNLNFGTVNVGASVTMPVTVTNNSTFPVTLTSVSATGDYSVQYGDCPAPPATLGAGASCTLQVTFIPTAAGVRSGTLQVATDATSVPLTVSLNGTAVQSQLQVTPSALAFGAVNLNTSSQLSLNLLNSGTAPVNAISLTLTGTNAAAFAVTTPCTATLAPNQGCTVTISFTPTAVGAFNANLNIASTDRNSPLIVPLSGSVTSPGSFTLTANGGSSASATVSSGSPATYTLTVTPVNGFTGTVALTCAPVNPGPYAACSLLPSTVTLNGASPANVTVTISTIAHAALDSPFRSRIFFALLAAPLLALRRKRFRALALLCLVSLAGCGGHSSSGGGGDNGIRYTPAGSYQYSVTATSVSGAAITQTVTLNLNVQ